MTTDTFVKTVSTKTTSIGEDIKQKTKIEKLQEHDKWKSEQARQVPIQIAKLELVSQVHDQLEVSVESGNGSSWCIKINLKHLKRFVKELDEVFPIEAGSVPKHKRVLPVLDLHKPLFGSKPPMKKQVESYLAGLAQVPTYILQSTIVVDMFLGDGPSTGSDTSYASSLKAPSITKPAKPHSKVKLSIDGDLVMIHVNEGKLGIDQFVSKIKDKLGLSSFPPKKFVYKDADGDEIHVLDDEDLEIALELYPTLLHLTHISD